MHAFIPSRLDYWNALYSGQVVQNAAARLLTKSKRFDHITPVIAELQWLPVDHQNLFFVFKAVNGLVSSYISNLPVHSIKDDEPISFYWYYLGLILNQRVVEAFLSLVPNDGIVSHFMFDLLPVSTLLNTNAFIHWFSLNFNLVMHSFSYT